MVHALARDSTRLSVGYVTGACFKQQGLEAVRGSSSCVKMVRDGSTERVGRKWDLGEE